MVRWREMWQRLAAQRCMCAAAAVLGLLALMTPLSASAAVFSVTGQGGAVPDNNATGVTFDITIPPNSGIIASSGNNVTLSLIGFTHPLVFDLTFTLEHVGFGSAQFLLDRVLDDETLVCLNNFLDVTYRFTNDATTTIQDICNLFRGADIPPGDYIPTLPDDVTDSEMSSFWNGQDVSGTWRLFISDTSFGGQSSNTTWTWRLDITLADEDADADGILDEDDDCPDTPEDAIVNADGCSIGQLCPCANNWKNHGAYVSCVAHAAEDFVDADLITEAQKNVIVSKAGQSSCGNKKK
jgi:hypothetical protein